MADALEIVSRQLRRDEGTRDRPYPDPLTRDITIGIGRNLTRVGLSDDEIEYLFGNDVQAARKECEHYVANFDALDPVRQAVLIEMAFNMGGAGFAAFTVTIACVERGDFEAAAAALLDSRAARQLPERYARLARQLKTGEEVG